MQEQEQEQDGGDGDREEEEEAQQQQMRRSRAADTTVGFAPDGVLRPSPPAPSGPLGWWKFLTNRRVLATRALMLVGLLACGLCAKWAFTCVAAAARDLEVRQPLAANPSRQRMARSSNVRRSAYTPLSSSS